jgi:hypothetical protein
MTADWTNLTVGQVSSTTEMIAIFSESLQSRLAECLKSLKKRVLYLQEKSEAGLYLKTIEFQGFWAPGETPVEPRSSLLLPSPFILVHLDPG